MNIITVGLDEASLKPLNKAIGKTLPELNFISLTDPMLVIKHSAANHIDVVFTEVNLIHMDGFTMIDILRKKYPEIKAVIVTGDARYKEPAILKGVDGYLARPPFEDEVTSILSSLRYGYA